jgi:hypothetical protein
MNWWDYLNPFTLLRFVLELVDAFLTPDLSENGPGATVYRFTFWVAATLVLFMAMVQLGVAAFRRDGQSLARVAVGTAQFLMVWVAWLTYAVVLLAACGGLTGPSWRPPWASTPGRSGSRGAFSTQDISDATLATVLGVMGLFLVLAAIGHLLVMLTRAGALLVLAATAPIAAAGLVRGGPVLVLEERALVPRRRVHPPLMALVIGVGIQLTTGVVTSTGDCRRRSAPRCPG